MEHSCGPLYRVQEMRVQMELDSAGDSTHLATVAADSIDELFAEFDKGKSEVRNADWVHYVVADLRSRDWQHELARREQRGQQLDGAACCPQCNCTFQNFFLFTSTRSDPD